MKRSTLIGLMILSDLVAIGLFIFALLQTPESNDLFSNPIAFVALGLFVVVPTALVILYVLNPQVADSELLRSGTLSYATVLEVWDLHTGPKGGLNMVGLKLQVNPNNDTPYETKTTAMVSSLDPTAYHAGMIIKVRYDPRHPRRVVIDDGGANIAPRAGIDMPGTVRTTVTTRVNVRLPQDSGTPDDQPADNPTGSYQIDGSDLSQLPPAIQKIVLAALVDADHNGIPDIMEKGGMNANSVQMVNLSGVMGQKAGPQERIAKLEKLRAAGLINQEMFDLLKSKIESAAQRGSGTDLG